MEKQTQCELAEKCGFVVPKLEKVRVGELPQKIKYPVITKSSNSLRLGWKDQIFICKSEEDLKNVFPKMKDDEIIVQEFVKKKNELCIDGLCINNGSDVYIPLYSLYYRIPDGDYGQYFFFEHITDNLFRKKIEELFSATKFSGIFSIEFLVGQDNELYFQEINFRNSTWSYAMTKCGVNLCYIYAKSILAGKLDTTSENISQKTPFSAMDEIAEFINNVPSRKMSFGDYIKEVKNCDCFLYYNKDDNNPFWSYIWHNVKNVLNIPKLVRFLLNNKK